MTTTTAAAIPSTFVRCGDLSLRVDLDEKLIPAVAAKIGSAVFGATVRATSGQPRRRGTARAAWVVVATPAPAPAPVSAQAYDASEWGVEAGDKLGRYQLMRELGRGANGQVWEALDPALKFMSEHEGETPLSPEDIAGIERGIAECKAGRGIDGETAFARFRATIAAAQRGNAA